MCSHLLLHSYAFGACPACYTSLAPKEEDLSYAAAVCEQAGVPLEVVPLQREYWEQVVSYTVREAREGRTPNPDVMCNSRIKFGMFYDHVGKHFRHVATGHYARLENVGDSGGGGVSDDAGGGTLTLKVGSDGQATEQGRVRLLLSPDAIKDQTYFLCALNQAQLRKALFPVGGYTKERIRELAESYDLPTKSRKDSQVRLEKPRRRVKRGFQCLPCIPERAVIARTQRRCRRK